MKCQIVLCCVVYSFAASLLVADEQDAASSDWARVTTSAPWSARHWLAAVTHGGRIWILGGVVDSASETQDPYVWSSPDGAAWTRESEPAPWLPAAAFGAVVFNNSIWILGDSIWTSLDGRTWRRASEASPWSGRLFPATVVYHNKIWVMGGAVWGKPAEKDVWCSDDGEAWTQVTESGPWGDRSRLSCAVFDDRLWVVAGGRMAEMRGLWWTVDGRQWTQAVGAPPWPCTGGQTVLSYHGKLWIIGGGIESEDCGVWNSNNGLVWNHVTASAPWSPRRFHASVIHDGKIWILGGQGTAVLGHEGDFIRSALGQHGDYAYFSPRGTISRPRRAVKFRLTEGEALPEIVGMVLEDSPEVQAAIAETGRQATASMGRGAADTDSGYRYIYHFKPPPGRLVMSGKGRSVSVPLPPGAGRLRASGCVVADASKGYVYVGTARGPSIPAEIVKFAMGNDEESPRVIGVAPLLDDECNLSCAAIDRDSGYAYFGANTNHSSSVVKIALGSGDEPPQRVGAVPLEQGERDLRTVVFDAQRRFAFFATRDAIIKIALGEDSAPPSRVGAVEVDMPSWLKNDVWAYGR